MGMFPPPEIDQIWELTKAWPDLVAYKTLLFAAAEAAHKVDKEASQALWNLYEQLVMTVFLPDGRLIRDNSLRPRK
jgi:hypothetical protein